MALHGYIQTLFCNICHSSRQCGTFLVFVIYFANEKKWRWYQAASAQLAYSPLFWRFPEKLVRLGHGATPQFATNSARVTAHIYSSGLYCVVYSAPTGHIFKGYWRDCRKYPRGWWWDTAMSQTPQQYSFLQHCLLDLKLACWPI